MGRILSSNGHDGFTKILKKSLSNLLGEEDVKVDDLSNTFFENKIGGIPKKE